MKKHGTIARISFFFATALLVGGLANGLNKKAEFKRANDFRLEVVNDYDYKVTTVIDKKMANYDEKTGMYYADAGYFLDGDMQYKTSNVVTRYISERHVEPVKRNFDGKVKQRIK